MYDGNATRVSLGNDLRGREFGNVFILGLEEEVFPRKVREGLHKSEHIENERRFLYFCMNRAKNALYFSFVAKRKGREGSTSTKKSMFVKEFDKNFLETIDFLEKKTVKERVSRDQMALFS